MKKIEICYSISCLLLLLLLSTFINKPLIENANGDILHCHTIGGTNSDNCIEYTIKRMKNFSEKQNKDMNVNGNTKKDLLEYGIIATG